MTWPKQALVASKHASFFAAVKAAVLTLPGPVMTVGSAGRPLEVSKAPLYGLVEDATKKQQGVFPVILPLRPLGELYAAGWGRLDP